MFHKVTAFTADLMPFCWVPGDPDPVLYDPWWPASGPSAPTVPDAPLPRDSSKRKRPPECQDAHNKEERDRRKNIEDSFGRLRTELPVAIKTPRPKVLKAAVEKIKRLETEGAAILAQRNLLIASVNAQLAALWPPPLDPTLLGSFGDPD